MMKLLKKWTELSLVLRILIGLALKLKGSEATLNVVSDFAEVVSLAVRWVIEFAPFGILGLVFGSVSNRGLAIFTTYGKLLLLLIGCMLFCALVVNPLVGRQYSHQPGPVQKAGPGSGVLLGEHPVGRHRQHGRCSHHHFLPGRRTHGRSRCIP